MGSLNLSVHPCSIVVCIDNFILTLVFINCLVLVGSLDMCPRTPMEPLEVHVEVVLIMWWFLVDQ